MNFSIKCYECNIISLCPDLQVGEQPYRSSVISVAITGRKQEEQCVPQNELSETNLFH